MRSIHDGLTVSAVVPPERVAALRAVMDNINTPDSGTPLMDFGAMPSLLFTSMVIAEAAQAADGTPLPYRLLIFTSYTGSRKVHLEELLRHGKAGLHQLFLHCEDYAETGPDLDEPTLRKYLRKHLIRNTYYTGSHFVTREDQEREHALREAIQVYLDEQWQDPAFAEKTPGTVRRDLQNYVREQARFQWAAKPYRLGFTDWLALYGGLVVVSGLMLFSLLAPVISAIWQGPPALLWWGIGSGVVLHLVGPLIQQVLSGKARAKPASRAPKKPSFSLPRWSLRMLVFTLLTTSFLAVIWNTVATFAHWPWVGVIFWGFLLGIILLLFLLRRNERIPAAPIEPLTDERVKEITVREYHPVVNEMSVINVLKPGWVRPFFLNLTLRLVPLIRAFNYIPSVHTARWLQTDGGRRLVFIAYFDNTSEGYAHDFVDSTKRTRNLNLIFGHALGFPATRYAILDGGKDRRQYMLGVRKAQLITGVWYNSHPELSITNVTNNRAIRKGLFGTMNKEETETWLALL